MQSKTVLIFGNRNNSVNEEYPGLENMGCHVVPMTISEPYDGEDPVAVIIDTGNTGDPELEIATLRSRFFCPVIAVRPDDGTDDLILRKAGAELVIPAGGKAVALRTGIRRIIDIKQGKVRLTDPVRVSSAEILAMLRISSRLSGYSMLNEIICMLVTDIRDRKFFHQPIYVRLREKFGISPIRSERNMRYALKKAQWENLKRLPSATVYGLGREKTVAGFVYAAALYISRTSDTEKTKKSDENPKKMQNYALHP